MITLYNTATRQKETFQPLVEQQVGLYVCGMTVYDFCHVGHARVSVVFDMIVRYLRHLEYNVHYVRNITDIDDKIINRANERGESYQSLASTYIEAMFDDEKLLGVMRPDEEPRATDYMAEMIDIIESLIAKEAAYVGDSGDVYFAVKACSHYGEFMQQAIEQLRVGARVDLVEAKRDPLDFVLWKLAKPGEPSWESPWGEGRPGWHIECSAMSLHCLGKTFDLHGGGIDLCFPHHQNEIAQSDTLNEGKSVNSWMHVGHVQINQEKMSKSLGNFFTLREVLKQYAPEVIRYFMLASHYRSPVNYADDNLESAKQALTRFYLALRDVKPTAPDELLDGSYDQRFREAMGDDFNTPEAFAVLFDLTRKINSLLKEGETQKAEQHAGLLKHLAGIIGFLQDDPATFLRGDLKEGDDVQAIEVLVKARELAREQNNWAKADEIRQQLQDQGIVLEDKGEGTQWRKIN